MNKTAILWLVAAMVGIPAASPGQSQSPDQQQQGKPETKPSPKANQPRTDTSQPPTGQSPDIQQQKNAPATSKQHKNPANARQAHGTPKPKTDTGATH